MKPRKVVDVKTKTEFHYGRGDRPSGWAVYVKGSKDLMWIFVTYADTERKANVIRSKARKLHTEHATSTEYLKIMPGETK